MANPWKRCNFTRDTVPPPMVGSRTHSKYRTTVDDDPLLWPTDGCHTDPSDARHGAHTRTQVRRMQRQRRHYFLLDNEQLLYNIAELLSQLHQHCRLTTFDRDSDYHLKRHMRSWQKRDGHLHYSESHAATCAADQRIAMTTAENTGDAEAPVSDSSQRILGVTGSNASVLPLPSPRHLVDDKANSSCAFLTEHPLAPDTSTLGVAGSNASVLPLLCSQFLLFLRN